MAYDGATIWVEERTQRKQILLRIIYVGIGLLLMLIIGVIALYGFSNPAAINGLLSMSGILLSTLVALALARNNHLQWATHLMFTAVLAAAFAIALPTGITSRAVFLAFVPIVGSALLLPGRWSYVYAGIAVVMYLTLYSLNGKQSSTQQSTFVTTLIFNLLFASAMFGITATLAALTAQRLDHLLRISMSRSQEVEAARAELEQRVEERTAGLQQALEELQQSGETIRQLSAPILPVAEGVLVLPLVGNINQERAHFITEQLLADVHRRRPRTVLFDLTGIGVVDLTTSQVLERLTTAVRLLGAEPVLVGISAELATIITTQDINVQNVISRRDVQSGLEYALEHDG